MSLDENKHEIGSFREEEEGAVEEEQPPEVLLIPVGFGDQDSGQEVPVELGDSNTTENNRTPLVENLKLSVWSYSKLVKWIAVAEAFVTVFYCFSLFWPMIFTLFLPAGGFVAGWKLHLILAYIYLGYLVVHLILRCVFMGLQIIGWFVFIQVIGLVIDFGAALIVYRFIRLLKILPIKQRVELLTNKYSEPQQENIA